MTDTLTRHSNDELKALASSIRQGIVTATHAAKSGHPGGSLSAADILTYLYFEEMNVDPANPRDPKRDRFVISKGHAAPGLYATLAERGFFDKAELETLRHIGSIGPCRPALGRGLAYVRSSRRRRDRGGPGVGGRHVRGQPQAG